MKFTLGYWHMRPEVVAHFAAQAYDTKTTADSLTVYAPTQKITHRGATLNCPLLTVRYSSPMENVIRVQVVHHKGGRPRTPTFELIELPAPQLTIIDEADVASLTSGNLTVRVAKGDEWLVAFWQDGRLLTQSGWRNLGFVDTPNGRFIHEQLSLSVGEYVYGLGERFTPFVKNGQVVDLWQEDGGTSSEHAYKNIPFYLTNRGYGVFINHPEHVSLEIGSEKVERVQFSVSGEMLDYFIIGGPTPKDVLNRYTALTGRPTLPPAWSFGLWLSTSFTTSYDEETVTSFVQGMAERDIPLQVFHFDCFWMKEFHWTNLKWDERFFDDPAAMLQRLKARGLKICVWINPYIAQRSSLFDEGRANGYLVMRPNGDVWQWDKWQAGMGLVDFTNPAACQWFQEKLSILIDMGVDSFKTDFGERIPTEVIYYDGSDPHKMHNYYTHLYNKTVFELLEEKLGVGQAAVFARSATTGGQKFPVHWGGDSTATFESMAESLRGGLSLTLSGFGFWSHDIGGFEQTAPAAVYKRWCAFGLLSSHSRLHGNESYRVPWLFDEEAVAVLRLFTKLKCRLMPYLFAAAVQAHQTGVPMMRAMMLEFPDDPAQDYLDRQYMLGDSLLVAPIFSYDGTVDYYLPNGRWTNFISGEVVEGGHWQRETHDFMSLPLMARPNSVIAVGNNERQAVYDYADEVTFHVFELGDGAATIVRVPTVIGETALTAVVERTGNTIHITTNGTGSWRFLLRNIATVETVERGTAETTAQGVLLTPAEGTKRLTVQLN